MADVAYVPDSNQANNYLPWMLAGNGGWGGGLFGGAGGAAFLGSLIGSIFPNIFGWNGAYGGVGANGAAAALGAQATANNNTDLIMAAIQGTDADVRALAASNGSDFNAVKAEVSALQMALATMGPSIINAIQAGDADLASRFCSCCCEMKQLVLSQGYENQIRTIEQTNTLGSAISASGQRTVDAIADLKTTVVKEFCDAKERDMAEKIESLTANNALLRSQIDNANQTATIAAMISPLQKELDDIRCKQPSTATVTYPNLVAVNATPYVSGGYYQGGFNGYYGSGVPGFGGNGIYF